MSLAPVTILTSGIGLGIYIPALLVEDRLRRNGIAAEVRVLESYYTPEHLGRHLAHKEASRSNFALALIAHRMARGVEPCLDRDRMNRLLTEWADEGRDRFIVWSGFWLPILERYRQMGAPPLTIHRCRIDAEISASFRAHRDLDAGGREIWLWHGKDQALHHEIAVSEDAPVAFENRDHRLVIHGGGWGLGTYRSLLPRLAKSGYALDVVIHDRSEWVGYGPRDRCFLADPAWHPWQKDDEGRHGFPPLLEAFENGDIKAHPTRDVHPFHALIRQALAVVSKPGGGTLIDSLAAATPLVILDAYGNAELRNGEVWAHLGFGIPGSKWEARGFDVASLLKAHEAIRLRRRGTVAYPDAYVDRLLQGAA